MLNKGSQPKHINEPKKSDSVQFGGILVLTEEQIFKCISEEGQRLWEEEKDSLLFNN